MTSHFFPLMIAIDKYQISQGKKVLEKPDIPLRRLKVAILKFSIMYLVNNVHAATSGIQLPLPLKTATSSKNCHFLCSIYL